MVLTSGTLSQTPDLSFNLLYELTYTTTDRSTEVFFSYYRHFRQLPAHYSSNV